MVREGQFDLQDVLGLEGAVQGLTDNMRALEQRFNDHAHNSPPIKKGLLKNGDVRTGGIVAVVVAVLEGIRAVLL